ncbi:MAG: 30S ribosomal protein S3 [Deltaproteobacteria bacterium]|nr:MAG: 30S ribosomal protein S3 [Deltaproteobacteria bacterium]
MGQKVHPVGFRLGVIRSWDSKWYGEKSYADWLHEDIVLREFIRKECMNAGVAKVEIERAANKVKISIHTARPGLIIGRKGVGIDALKKKLARLTDAEMFLKIEEVRRPDLDAQLVADSVAQKLLRRVAFRRAMKQAVGNAMKLGAQGIRIGCAGRLGGAEMARREQYLEGRVPLHTLRADIDYGFSEAVTTYGSIGVKVWIFKGEVIHERKRN